MAEGILGLGSGQASTLNQELIDKLKEAEREATVAPIEDRIDDIIRVADEDGNTDGEAMRLATITAKANELLETIKPFDLYVSGGVTAFDMKSANVTGTSAVFDAADESALNEGTTSVFIEQLAKRDVFQSFAVDSTVKEADINAGNLVVTIGGEDLTFDTTDKTYEELVDEMNFSTEITASLEQVGDDSYRIVIKSAESGLSNALTFSGAATTALGFDDADSQVQNAQNLLATVNGIDYNVSTNVITVDGGLKITAVEENDVGEFSTISIENDTTYIDDYLQNFVDLYNELVSLVDQELYSADSPMEDTSTLRNMMEGIKDKLFGSYGADSDLNIFNFGLEVDKSGLLSIDSEKLNDAVANNLEDLKSLFLGTAENEGLGTQLKTYIDDLDGFDGLLYTYEQNMNSRQETLEEEKEKAEESLENKYALLAQQFAAYSTIITQMESSFAGLSLMIEQSTAG